MMILMMIKIIVVIIAIMIMIIKTKIIAVINSPFQPVDISTGSTTVNYHSVFFLLVNCMYYWHVIVFCIIKNRY